MIGLSSLFGGWQSVDVRNIQGIWASQAECLIPEGNPRYWAKNGKVNSTKRGMRLVVDSWAASLGNRKLPFERKKEEMVGRFEDEEKALLEK